MPGGLFDGLFRPPRQRQFTPPQPMPGPGFMNMGGMAQGGGGNAGDAQSRALQQFGPNGLLALQMYRGMMAQGPRGIMDPAKASMWFSPQTIGGLAPRYQAAFAKQNKTGKK